MSRLFATATRLVALWLTSLCLATPQLAQASQVVYRDQDLASLLGHLESSPTAVVTLTLATPATERQEWPVPGKGAKRCPPYQGWQYRGRIETIHFASRGAPSLQVGAQLLVSPSTMLDLIHLEHLACAEGISKSPIWERFAGIEPKPGQAAVAVLAWHGEYGWLERVSGAWLDPKDLPKVLALLPPAKRFSPRDALLAEWSRQPPDLRPEETLAADRPRLAQSLARIGAPGAPALLPPELATPTEEQWLAKAAVAREPLERFTALMFLNRLKSKRSWVALTGLTEKDAAGWPAEPDLTWALQRASEISAAPAELQAFLQRYQLRPLDPARRSALAWRRFLTGQSRDPGPLVHTRAELLATSEQWARANEEQKARGLGHCRQTGKTDLDPMACLLRWGGSLHDMEAGATLQAVRHGWCAGTPNDRVDGCFSWLTPQGTEPGQPRTLWPALLQLTELTAVEQLPLWRKTLPEGHEPLYTRLALGQNSPPWRLARALPVVRQLDAAAADRLRAQLLSDPSPLARAAAIDDLPTAPTETQSLVASILRDREVDAAQALVSAVERWLLPKPKAAALLSPLLQGAVWAVWLQAWQALHKLEPATPWPGAPDLTARDREILALAEQLLTRTKPVRLKLNFASPAPGSPSGKVIRQVVLQLDAQRAPINVANLLLLARKGFYTGRAISRVVPEFVLQLGSPLETMDGGPGYHVPCENHLAPYTAGSVGMALSGKDTGGSQFFVTLAAAPHLTGSYTRVGFLEDLPRSLKVVRDLGPGDVLVQVSEL